MVVVEGRSMKEAFRSAVENARFEYGNRGYTGTIAEKSECIAFTPRDSQLEPFFAKVKEKLGKQLDEMRAAKPGPDGDGGARLGVLPPVHDGEGAGRGDRQAGGHPGRSRLREEALLLFANDLSANDKRAQDKWGPCVGIEVRSPDEVKRLSKDAAQKLLEEKYGPGVQVEVSRRGDQTMVQVGVKKNGVLTIGPYGSAVGKDADEARGLLFAKPGKYVLFGTASC
jgi:hypothetical protein